MWHNVHRTLKYFSKSLRVLNFNSTKNLVVKLAIINAKNLEYFSVHEKSVVEGYGMASDTGIKPKSLV